MLNSPHEAACVPLDCLIAACASQSPDVEARVHRIAQVQHTSHCGQRAQVTPLASSFTVSTTDMLPEQLITAAWALCMSAPDFQHWSRCPCSLGEKFQDPQETSIHQVMLVLWALSSAFERASKRLQDQAASIPQGSVEASLARCLALRELGLLQSIAASLKRDLEQLALEQHEQRPSLNFS